jgi:TonB-linked SusC/RagA family outer membrane protein
LKIVISTQLVCTGIRSLRKRFRLWVFNRIPDGNFEKLITQIIMFRIKQYYIAGKSCRFIISALSAILILLCLQDLNAQQNQTQIPFTVYGSVKDDKGVAVMGALVQIQESTRSTTTDEDGNFELDVPGMNTVLNVEADGFLALSVKVLNAIVDIVLVPAPEGQGIKDRVIMPWAVTDKRSVTGSITTIGQEELRKSPVMSLSAALSGRLPGFTVIQQAGTPGNETLLWRIRGLRTLESGGMNNMDKGGLGTPIAIVDGFERPFTDFDASEIEAVSVLRDAAATALYGLRGANGVILITTKRGQANKRTIDLEVSSGIVAPMRLPKFMGSYDYATLYNEARVNDGLPTAYTYDDLIKYISHDYPLTHPDNNYYKEFIKPFARQDKAALTLSGGNQLLRYFVSLAYNKQNGLYDRTGESEELTTKVQYTRFNTRGNLDITISPRITAFVNVAGRIELRGNTITAESNVFDYMARFPPNAYPLSFTGIDPATKLPIFMLGGTSQYTTNLLGVMSYRGFVKGTRRYYQVAAGVKYDLDFITKGLSARFQMDADGYNLYDVSTGKQYLVWERKETSPGVITYTSYNTAALLSYSYSSNTNQSGGLNLSMNYDRTFGLHSVKALAMMNHSRIVYPQANQADRKFEDFALRTNYSYNNRYFLEATANLSSSDNIFLTKQPRILFYAVSGAWIVSDESFLKDSKIFPYMKLRASYGLTGNDEYTYTDPNGYKYRYPYRTRWWSSTSQVAYGIAPAYMPNVCYEGVVPNPDFTSEKGRMINVGIETKHFANRLDISVDLWSEKRYDIFSRGLGSLPNTYGVLNDFLPIGNEGIVNSKGFELSLEWSETKSKFSYWIRPMVDYSVNKIEYMAEPARAETYLVETGGPVTQDFGLVSLGLFKNQADIDASPVQRFGPVKPGDIKYADLNKDGEVNSLDYTAIGDGALLPTLSYAADMGIKVGQFDFSMLWQGSSHKSNYLSSVYVRPFANYAGISEFARNRYISEANWATADFPRLTTLANDNNNRISTFWLKDATFIRLRNLEIGYNFKNLKAKAIGLNGLRIYANAYNLFTFDNLKVLDPEDPTAGVSRYPMTRIINLGLILKF